MKIVVTDTSSLILLSKSSVLEAACSRYEMYVPPSVEREASSPELRETHVDAVQIHDLIQRDLLKVRDLKGGKRRLPLLLGPGEGDAIRLFLQLRADAVLTDDGKAIKVCRMLSIPFTISPNLVMALFKDGRLPFEEAVRSLEKLRVFGRYSPDIIASVLVRIRQEKDRA